MFIPVVRNFTTKKLFMDFRRSKKLNLLQRARWYGKNATELENRRVYRTDIQRTTEPVNKAVETAVVKKRPLGGIEKYFYDWTNIWDDAFNGSFSLSSKQPIKIAHLVEALNVTVQQYPMLRTSFEDSNDFVEIVLRQENTINFEIVEHEDFISILQSFSLGSKLWRFIVLNPGSHETNTLSFIFAVHHALADYTHCRSIIRDVFKNLSILQYGGCIEPKTDVELSEPIENISQNVERKNTNANLDFATSDWTNKNRIKAVDVCNRHFGKTGKETFRENSTKTLRWCIDKNLSHTFKSSLSNCQGSINAALLTVFLSSFMEVVQNSIDQSEVVDLPYSMLVDLRRYIGNGQEYNGSACIDMEGLISMDSVLNSKNNFWTLAVMISKKIREMVESGVPLRYINKDANFTSQIENNHREVILLTHVGLLDDFLGSADHFELDNFEFNMRTSSEVGPIFQVITHFLREELCVTLGYNCTLIPDSVAHDMANKVIEVIKRIV